MSHTDPKDLFEKFIRNQCSEAEIAALLHFFEDPAQEEVLRHLLDEQLAKEPAPGMLNGIDLDQKEKIILAHLQPALPPASTSSKPIRKLWPAIAAAAAAVVFVVAAGLYLHTQRRLESPIFPGGSMARLTLYNGKIILLDSSKSGQVIKEDNITIGKTKTGQLVFDLSTVQEEAARTGYNTITTPAGGQYQVVLQDGTQVWLNAASSIRFPAAFSSASRVVELQGEAYFEVAKISNTKGRIPFFVKSAGQEVEVLGTHFDVDSYSDEPFTKTTLLEGSVSVKAAGQQRIIKPGEQSRLKSGVLNVLAVNAEDEIAWKNGNFQFNEADIQTVMRAISRWYNVTVVFEGPPTQETFGGTISRSKNLREVLNSLEETGAVKFLIDGRTVKVTQ
ncbi:FecR family protein [Chitinophaga costaii]|uniref:FecR family protein n=1 Tax=Chitinophaga costaii TaxID=1335309 RepID=A0A1C4E8B8_9BACT|nr:FecR domain-containing protein [Chitinophaga costaii]PUZ24254.1 FecR family protein [Chitinophaga costaii]SCC39814.1 FecR family protein [Chitinophaga costaii]